MKSSAPHSLRRSPRRPSSDDDVQQLLPDLDELVEECQLLQDLDHFEDFDLEDLELEDDAEVHVEEEEEEEEVSPLCMCEN